MNSATVTVKHLREICNDVPIE